MTIVSGSSGFGSGTAQISTTGVATFNVADNTLAERIIATENGINANGMAAAGQVAMFQFGADAYVFVSDGINGVGANDVLVELTGVNTALAAYDTITLAGGNFTLA